MKIEKNIVPTDRMRGGSKERVEVFKIFLMEEL